MKLLAALLFCASTPAYLVGTASFGSDDPVAHPVETDAIASETTRADVEAELDAIHAALDSAGPAETHELCWRLVRLVLPRRLGALSDHRARLEGTIAALVARERVFLEASGSPALPLAADTLWSVVVALAPAVEDGIPTHVEWSVSHLFAAGVAIESGRLDDAALVLESWDRGEIEDVEWAGWNDFMWCLVDLDRAAHTRAHARCSSLLALVDGWLGQSLTEGQIALAIAAVQVTRKLGRAADFIDLITRLGDYSLDAEIAATLRVEHAAFASYLDNPLVAFELASEVLELLEGADATNDDVAAATIHRAYALLQVGDLESARESYQLILETEGMEPRYLAPAHEGLALLASRSGDHDEAERAIEAALDILRSTGRLTSEQVVLSAKAEVLGARGRWAEAWQLVADAEAFLASAPVDELGAEGAARLRRLLRAWSHATQDLVAGEHAAASTEARGEIAARGLREIVGWSGRSLAVALGHADLFERRAEELVERIQAELEDDETLVHFAAGTLRLYAYVLTDDSIRFVDLGPRYALENAAWRLAQEGFIRGGEGRPARDSVRSYCELAAPLYRDLIEPLGLDRSEDATLGLLVVATPMLSSLPLEALVRSVGEDANWFGEVEFLCDDHDVTYLTTATQLLASSDARADASDDARPLLILGDVIPAETVEEPELIQARQAFEPFARLDHDRNEVFGVAASLLDYDDEDAPTRRRLDRLRRESETMVALTDHPGFHLFTGKHATADRLAEAGARYRGLHVVAHGAYLDLQPERTALALWPSADGSPLLTLDEIRAMDLELDFVVLSACSSGEASPLPGDGTRSLAAAFMESGARRVLATLSPVRDAETHDLMLTFYDALARGASVEDALRAARIRIRTDGAESMRGIESEEEQSDLTDYGHPAYWAPVVIFGG